MFGSVRCLFVTGLVGIIWTASPVLAAPAEQEKHCDEVDATSVSSPDGTWTARSYGEVCDLGISSSATVLVELIRAGSVNLRQVILGMDMPATTSAWPKVTWDSSNKLSLDLPSNAQIGLQIANFQGVEVDVRFCPRDPAIRTKWLEYRVAYRQWLVDTSAWNEMKKRDPASDVPKPPRPMAPGSGTSATCSG